MRFHTFNYELVIERIIKEAGLHYTYTKHNTLSDIPIRKLHGSINWMGPRDHLSHPDYVELFKQAEGWVYASGDLDSPPGLSAGIFEEPVLIPPQAQKIYSGIIDQIWRFAEGDITSAEKVLIVGYSFPPLDSFATVCLQEALAGKEVYYVNRDSNSCARAKSLLYKSQVHTDISDWDLSHFQNFRP